MENKTIAWCGGHFAASLNSMLLFMFTQPVWIVNSLHKSVHTLMHTFITYIGLYTAKSVRRIKSQRTRL